MYICIDIRSGALIINLCLAPIMAIDNMLMVEMLTEPQKINI